MKRVSFRKSFSCLMVLAVSASALSAQTKTSTATPAKAPAMAPAQAAGATAETASQFYLRYRAAFDKAKKIEDLLPFMSADHRKQVDATPAAQRPQMFEMMKMVGALTAVKITKEERTPTGATLTAEGMSDGKKQTGTIKIIREGGALKLGEESWKGSM